MSRHVCVPPCGCQMHVRDSEEVLGILQQQGSAAAEGLRTMLSGA